MDIQKHLETARRTGELEFFIEERREDCVVSRMPVMPGALNPFGTVQAGAMLWMADVTATVLAIGSAELGAPTFSVISGAGKSWPRPALCDKANG